MKSHEKPLSETHLNQIKNYISFINQQKERLSQIELEKYDLIQTINRLGKELNTMVSQFPALYDVPENSQIDIEKGTIVYFTTKQPEQQQEEST